MSYNLQDHQYVNLSTPGQTKPRPRVPENLEEVMSRQRKNELDLYRLYAQDDGFKQAFVDAMKRMTGL